MNSTITVTDSPTEEEVGAILKILADYNTEQAGDRHYRPLAVILRDEYGNLLGGLKGGTLWGWLYIEWLAIDAAARRKGTGSKILQAAEAEARNRACKGIFLDTFSFQAKGFYLKHGYEEYGQLDDFPAGHARHYLCKRF